MIATWIMLKLTSNLFQKKIGCFTTFRLLHETLIDPLPNTLIPLIKLPPSEHGTASQINVISNCNIQLNSQNMLLQHKFVKSVENFSLISMTNNQKLKTVEYNLPLTHLITPVEEPISNLPLETAKSDIKWRRRRMRRHKLLRWRKKYPQIVEARLKRKLQNREDKQKEALEKSWKMYGLTEEPPPLSEEEKAKLQQAWREEGIWNEPLSIEEHANYERVVRIMKRTDKK